MNPRSLPELINTDEPGLDLVRDWISSSTNTVQLLECDQSDGDQTLLDLQVTTRSPMGAIAHGTGGLLIDGGWVRVLGAGCPRLPRSIASWNEMKLGKASRLPGAILVGDDVVGGFFAISGGGIPVPSGKVGYYAPDTLAWEDTDQGYSDWLRWLLRGDLDLCYENVRWDGWRDEIDAVGGDQALSSYPFLWAKGAPVGQRHRKPVALNEVWELNTKVFPEQLTGN